MPARKKINGKEEELIRGIYTLTKLMEEELSWIHKLAEERKMERIWALQELKNIRQTLLEPLNTNYERLIKMLTKQE